MLPIILHRRALLMCLGGLLIAPSADAQTLPAPDHAPLDALLRAIVVPFDLSAWTTGPVMVRPATGTRLAREIQTVRPFVGNRVAYEKLDGKARDTLRRYIASMEAIDPAPLESDAALAFWLNLHTALMLDTLAQLYPISSVRPLEQHKRLDDVRVTLAGNPMSIRAIRQHVVGHWPDPLVFYGLWQGSVGGPDLPMVAYSASSVGGLLAYNARALVRSDRAFKGGRGSGLRIAAGLGDPGLVPKLSDAELRAHLAEFASPEQRRRIEQASTLDPSLRDESLADTRSVLATIRAAQKQDIDEFARRRVGTVRTP